jgi:hypothetical protein
MAFPLNSITKMTTKTIDLTRHILTIVFSVALAVDILW